MAEQFINKVAESGIITLDPAAHIPVGATAVFDMKDHLFMAPLSNNVNVLGLKPEVKKHSLIPDLKDRGNGFANYISNPIHLLFSGSAAMQSISIPHPRFSRLQGTTILAGR